MRGTTSRRASRRGQASTTLSSPMVADAGQQALSDSDQQWALAKAFVKCRGYATFDLAAGAVLAAALVHVNAGFALAVSPDGRPIASAASPTAAHELTARDYEQAFAAATGALGGLPAGNAQVLAIRLQSEGRVVGALALKPTVEADANAFRSAGGMLGECLAEMFRLDQETSGQAAADASSSSPAKRGGDRDRMSERLTDALASHKDGVALFDADGGLVAANPAFAEAHGARVRDLRGLTIEEILRRRDVGLPPAWLGRDLSAGAEGALFALAADGRWLRLAGTKSAAGDNMVLQSPAEYLATGGADAQRRVQAADRADAERLAIWDGVAAGVVLLSEAGRVLDVNREAARMMGAPARRLKGRKMGRLDGAEPEGWSRVRRDVENAPSLVVRARRLVDGRTLLTMMEAPENPDVIDASQQGRIKRALATTDALGELGHEMRTPLNAVIGFADILQAKSFGPINERQSQYLADIGRAGHHMLEMVEHMFDHAQLSAGRYPFNPEWVDLSELLEGACRMLQPAADEGEVTLAVVAAPRLDAYIDRGGMLQALINLLANSVKFTPPGGTVKLGAELGSDVLELQVSDTGEGIPAADLERVMEPFTQARRLGVKPLKGAGLGLSIVTALAELHGGAVSIASEFGEGTTVAIRLPGDKVRQGRAS